ncbi:hypothetical protein VE04_00851 [Pseudogymnoascus sp. 24MN13]|nr:hypothetical protein VE04_00851 [Pseudogymnoascus sp. 24MN13]
MDLGAQIGEGSAASCGTVTDDVQSGKDVRTYVNRSRWSSIAVAGRLDEAVFDLALDIEVCGRAPYDDGGRTPGPTLLAKLLAEVFLEEEDCGRDDVDEAIDVLRALVREVPLTTERPGAKLVFGFAGSPARSTSVFRFGSSLPTICKEAVAVGSGIAPFFPVTSPTSTLYLPVNIFLFVVKLPLFLAITVAYFFFLQWLPLGAFIRKAMLWVILGAPGIWWIDLQIDGVKKGSLAREKQRLPAPSSIIASSFTSPVDALYLAAIFDPVFTVSYPGTRQVRPISLLGAMLRALSGPEEAPPAGVKLVDLGTLVSENPDSVIVVFPECTTTNGKGILPLSPSLLNVPSTTKIFPINLRYSPPDITTPVPGRYWSFLWNLLSQQTHCIRVRIAEAVYNTAKPGDVSSEKKDKYLVNFLDLPEEDSSDTSSGMRKRGVNAEEQKVLDQVGEALARLGRVKRVGLTVKDKAAFVGAWSKKIR